MTVAAHLPTTYQTGPGDYTRPVCLASEILAELREIVIPEDEDTDAMEDEA